MKKNYSLSTVKTVFGYLKHYRYLFILSVLLAAASVVGSLYVPIGFGRAIDAILSRGNVDFDVLKAELLRVGIAFGTSALAQWLMNVCNNKITYSIVRNVRKDAFDKIQRLPLSYLDSHPHGDTVSRIIADVDTFADGLLMGFTQFFTGIATIVGTLVLMVYLNWIIALAVVVITPLSLFTAKYIAGRTHSLFVAQSKTKGEQTAFIEEMIGNSKTVQAFSHEDENQEKFDEINARLADCSLKATFYSSLTNPSTRFINNIVYVVVALMGSLMAIYTASSPNPFTVGTLSTFLSFANQYTKPFNEISAVVTELQNSLACADRVFDFIHEKELAKEPDASLLPARGSVEIKNVDFSYTADKALIEDFSLSVEQGRHVAIVGPTGCGKTTLINLLMRFYEPTAGKILVDSTPIDSVTRHSLRKNYGMVLQDTWIRRGTVRDNIALSKPDATDEEIIAAAKAANAHPFIQRLKDGYDTVLGEDGGILSAGQKQLLCIARVMLSLPPMLILDEATSSIDTRTELIVQNAFLKMMQGRTTFIVAHRLSTVQNADLIIVMQDGNVVESGTHRELLAKNGFYTRLYHSQFES